MIELLRDFAGQFDARIDLDEKSTVKKRNRYFLLQPRLGRFVSDDFYYAGMYLGKTKEGRFFPSFIFLQMISECRANKVIIDDKTAWLFICGRDVFRKGIAEIHGSGKKGSYTLVMNRHGECLGFGRISCDLSDMKKGVVIRNIADVGDFLRRERSNLGWAYFPISSVILSIFTAFCSLFSRSRSTTEPSLSSLSPTITA